MDRTCLGGQQSLWKGLGSMGQGPKRILSHRERVRQTLYRLGSNGGEHQSGREMLDL
jgi:hypothetical protein